MKLADLPGPDWSEFATPVSKLRTDGENPNEMSEEQFGNLVRHIKRRGWIGGPVIADSSGLISDGEHRWKAAKELSLEDVPAILSDEMDDAERRMVRLSMNKIHGEHDPKRDALEFDYLLDEGYREEIFDLLDARDESAQEYLDLIRVDNSREVNRSIDVEHDVFYEECLGGMERRLEDDSVDLVLTDPPYGIGININDSMGRTQEIQHTGTVIGDTDPDEAIELWDAVMGQIDRVLKPDGHLYCYASWKTYGEFKRVIEAHGFDVMACIVWLKSDANYLTAFGEGVRPRYAYKHEFIIFALRKGARDLNGYYEDVMEHVEPRFTMETSDLMHPTQKPVAQLQELIGNSTAEGDVVLDPFMGSGSTAVASILSGRSPIGFEQEEQYQQTINHRIADAVRQFESPSNAEEDEVDPDAPPAPEAVPDSDPENTETEATTDG